MSTYFEFLWVFLLLFALLYVLVYMPGVLVIKKRSKQNLIFLFSCSLMFFIEAVYGRGDSKVSYAWSIGFLFFALNIYLLVNDTIKRKGKGFSILTDFILCSFVLFLSSCIIAYVDDLPIRDKVLQQFDNGTYTFIPGCLYEMVSTSTIFSLIITNFKYIHLYLLNKWEERQKKRINKLESQKKNIEIQFDALQAKVNPHFLYNSLNSIAGLATIDGNKTRKMALALAQFFRYSMNREQEMMITVEQEAEMIGTYLEIEKIRFGDKLNYDIRISDDSRYFKIPRMLIQPVVENSIKHGMKGSVASLKVDVSFFMSDTALAISIKDNGTPFPKDIIPGYGIQSVYDKLDLLFPEKYNIELETNTEKDFKIYLYPIK